MISFLSWACLTPSHFCRRAIHKIGHLTLVFALTTAFIIAPFPQVGTTEAQAARGDRTLWLHFTHTGEEKKITFRRNGKYDPEGIKQLQWMVRDWRRNKATKMDPRLFDLVWSVYQEAGATTAIRVVSGYRSRKTNDSLRRRSRGVAKTSQHTAGRAMDFYIPGVPVKKLREIGLKMQIGGVGYYPGSKTPFVHMDTGSVRHWPRMTSKQIARLFPDGKTLHRDTNNRNARGYNAALAEYKVRQTELIQPLSKSKRTQIAAAKPEKKRTGGLLASLFNGNQKEKTPEAPKVIAASVSEPAIAPKPTVAPVKKALAEEPKIIANKTTEPDTSPIPSRIGRPVPVIPEPVIVETPASKPAEPVVVALAPAPRALPLGLREQFTPAQSIVVASAPAPLERPVEASGVSQPQVIVAKASIPQEILPRAIDPTKTAALTRKDFNVPTPQVVKNRLAAIPDPTRLVLNEQLTKPVKPTLSPKSSTTLAYASATDPIDSLPQLDANEFNNRFGQISTSGSNVSTLPTKAIKQLTAAERYAALEIQQEQSTFSLNDIGIKSKERQLALRKSLGLLDDQTADKAIGPVVIASTDPNALIHSEISEPVTTPNLKVELPKQPVLTAATEPKQQARSLTDEAGNFAFIGEGKQVVKTLLTSASVTHVPFMNFELPKPSHMPSLFAHPTRAYAGSFRTAATKAPINTFTGDTITVTPTIDFERAANVRLSWLIR